MRETRLVCSMIWLPYAFRSGIRMQRVDAETFTAELPFRRFNKNWYNAMAGAALLAGPVVMEADLLFTVPRSASRKVRADSLAGFDDDAVLREVRELDDAAVVEAQDEVVAPVVGEVAAAGGVVGHVVDAQAQGDELALHFGEVAHAQVQPVPAAYLQRVGGVGVARSGVHQAPVHGQAAHAGHIPFGANVGLHLRHANHALAIGGGRAGGLLLGVQPGQAAQQAQREGVRDLRQSGLIKVRSGVTSSMSALAERVTWRTRLISSAA